MAGGLGPAGAAWWILTDFGKKVAQKSPETGLNSI
jgi:hypothetical protein